MVTLLLFPELQSILFCSDFEGKECYRCYPDGSENEISHQYPKLIGIYRQLNPGMIDIILLASNAVRHDCLIVGNRVEDIQATEAVGINFMTVAIWRQ